MPVVVVMMIEFFFSFVRKGRDRRKKEKKKDSASFCVFLSFFLSLMGQQLQSPAATTALCTLPKRALPGAQVQERETHTHTANSYLLFLNNNWSLTNHLPNPLDQAN
jgi:hypothetical protein